MRHCWHLLRGESLVTFPQGFYYSRSCHKRIGIELVTSN